MQIDRDSIQKLLSEDLMDVLIRLGLVAFLVVMCVRIFAPFMGLVLWALVLAVTLYPIQQRLANQLVVADPAKLFQPGPVYLGDDAFANNCDRIRRAMQCGGKLILVIAYGLAGFVQSLFHTESAQLPSDNRLQAARMFQGNHVLRANFHRGGDLVFVDGLAANDDWNARRESITDLDDHL